MQKSKEKSAKLIMKKGKQCNMYYYSKEYKIDVVARDARSVVKSITRTKDDTLIGYILTEFKPDYAPIRTRAFVLAEEEQNGKS